MLETESCSPMVIKRREITSKQHDMGLVIGRCSKMKSFQYIFCYSRSLRRSLKISLYWKKKKWDINEKSNVPASINNFPSKKRYQTTSTLQGVLNLKTRILHTRVTFFSKGTIKEYLEVAYFHKKMKAHLLFIHKHFSMNFSIDILGLVYIYIN